MLHVEHVSRLAQVDVGAGADHSRDRLKGAVMTDPQICPGSWDEYLG